MWHKCHGISNHKQLFVRKRVEVNNKEKSKLHITNSLYGKSNGVHWIKIHDNTHSFSRLCKPCSLTCKTQIHCQLNFYESNIVITVKQNVNRLCKICYLQRKVRKQYILTRFCSTIFLLPRSLPKYSQMHIPHGDYTPSIFVPSSTIKWVCSSAIPIHHNVLWGKQKPLTDMQNYSISWITHQSGLTHCGLMTKSQCNQTFRCLSTQHF